MESQRINNGTSISLILALAGLLTLICCSIGLLAYWLYIDRTIGKISRNNCFTLLNEFYLQCIECKNNMNLNGSTKYVCYDILFEYRVQDISVLIN